MAGQEAGKGRQLNFSAAISRDGEFYRVWLPAFSGVNSQGKTREEAKKNIVDALEGMAAIYRENELPLPEAK